LVRQAAIELLENWKPYLFTITSDNGKEFAMHQEIATVLEVDFYFANPYSPWQRGANENLNGLIRQYIPKSTSFEEITIERIIEIQEKLNNRPRKDLILKHQIICLIKSCICNLNPALKVFKIRSDNK
jgi:IS30 family transposase